MENNYNTVHGSLVPRPNKQGPIRVENITDDHSRQEFMDINNLSLPSAYLLWFICWVWSKVHDNIIFTGDDVIMLVSYPACTHLPARNSLVNKVKFSSKDQWDCEISKYYVYSTSLTTVKFVHLHFKYLHFFEKVFRLNAARLHCHKSVR